MPGPKLFILLNAKSGHHDNEDTQLILRTALDQAQRDYELILIEDAANLEQLSRDTLPRVVACDGILVIAGGDGAINAVSQVVAGSNCKFGVLPHGTFNYFSRTHGIPSETLQALQVILEGNTQWVQTGVMNDRVFVVNASLGLYPQLLEDREGHKKKYGRSRLVAFVSGILSVFGQHRLLRLQIDENGVSKRIVTQTLFIGNNPLQMEQVGIALVDKIEKDHLGAILLKPVNAFKMLVLVIRGMLGKLGEADSVSSFSFRSLTVRPSFFSRHRRIKVATDGEILWVRAPLIFRVWPDSLLLLKPRSALAKDTGIEPETLAAEKKLTVQA